MTVMTLDKWNYICKRISNLEKRIEDYNENRGAMVSKTFVGFLETQLTDILMEVKKYN